MWSAGTRARREAKLPHKLAKKQKNTRKPRRRFPEPNSLRRLHSETRLAALCDAIRHDAKRSRLCRPGPWLCLWLCLWQRRKNAQPPSLYKRVRRQRGSQCTAKALSESKTRVRPRPADRPTRPRGEKTGAHNARRRHKAAEIEMQKGGDDKVPLRLQKDCRNGPRRSAMAHRGSGPRQRAVNQGHYLPVKDAVKRITASAQEWRRVTGTRCPHTTAISPRSCTAARPDLTFLRDWRRQSPSATK